MAGIDFSNGGGQYSVLSTRYSVLSSQQSALGIQPFGFMGAMDWVSENEWLSFLGAGGAVRSLLG